MKALILIFPLCFSGCSVLDQLGPRTPGGALDVVRLGTTVAESVVAGIAEAEKADPDWVEFGVWTILSLLGLGGAGKGLVAAHRMGKKNGGSATA